MRPDDSESEYRDIFREQVQHLFRLADEAQACAELLRQEAERYQRALDDESLDEDELRRLMHERDNEVPDLNRFRVTDRLM